ncbi:MAG TPA: glycosyl transferase [Burkholderiales bacterium]|nr:glycosyl transferase [Burkholderiales bacterium]
MVGLLALISFVVTFAALRLLLVRFARVALDQPNERSLHERPVPRTGGIGLLAGAALSLAFGATALWLPLSLAAALAVLSFADDLLGLPTGVRFAAHLVAAALVAWYLMSPMHPAELALLAVGVAWITNLYNFMDGSDGLAGGMALFGFGTYALAASVAGDAPLAAASVALAAAAAAFLLLNFPPARIFLGDVGSVPLGFLAAALGLSGWRDDVWPLWFPLLVFAPFIGDATLTLIRRAIRGERVWRAHREHYYQRLVQMGAGHRGTALIAYGLMLICAAAALYARSESPAVQAAVVVPAAVVLIIAAAWIDLRWSRHVRRAAG